METVDTKTELLTVFTPTYNRKETLMRLYESLLRQTKKEFQWLIADDGSFDGTRELVLQWIEEKKIQIRYFYQENGGKNRAIVRGIDLCETPWVICVDSDDCLSENAVSCMLEDIRGGYGETDLGFIYPQCMNGAPSAQWIPEMVTSVNIMDVKHLYGITETAILFRTKYLKQTNVPRFEGEKFLSEEILYIQLAELGKFVPRNKEFYLSEYQNDGLTKNLFRIWKENPKGTICLLQNRFAYCGRYPTIARIKNRVKCIMNLNAFCMAKDQSWYELTPSKAYSMLLYLPSILWKKIRFE